MSAEVSLPEQHGGCRNDTESSLRMARILRRMGQASLGPAIGKYRSWISRVESGDVVASVTEKVRISRVREIPVEELFPENEEE